MKIILGLALWVIVILINRKLYQLCQKKNGSIYNSVGVTLCFIPIVGTLVFLLLLSDLNGFWVKVSEFFRYKEEND